jgi:uncharacterized protein YidB (DUF937 family)
MGLLDGVLGGLVGSGVSQLISSVLTKQGGLAGLVSAFEQKGLGNVAQSWVGKGANQSISADQLKNVLGADTLNDIAAKLGLNSQDVSKQLAELLPGAIDKMTPDGVIPKHS